MSRKKSKKLLSFRFFNDAVGEQSTGWKDLGIHLDEKLDFNAHLKDNIVKPIGILELSEN